MTEPLVSCLMVTRNRARLARRSLACLLTQTWPNKELVVVDDGDQDYGEILAPLADRIPVHYHRVDNREGISLGGLRNIALDRANGDFCVQWDDDEWFHPQRIEAQMQAVRARGLDAVVLHWTLVHVDSPRMTAHPFRACLGRGTPGTVLHRRTALRYPDLPRGEDSEFWRRLSRNLRVGTLTDPHGHLFIRCFHGDNTWSLRHFTGRLYRSLPDLLHYCYARFVVRDLFVHPAFRLTPAEMSAVQQYLSLSRELDLLTHAKKQ
jgi:glycosyltransferase involved in cell wall biosynthesis